MFGHIERRVTILEHQLTEGNCADDNFISDKPSWERADVDDRHATAPSHSTRRRATLRRSTSAGSAAGQHATVSQAPQRPFMTPVSDAIRSTISAGDTVVQSYGATHSVSQYHVLPYVGPAWSLNPISPTLTAGRQTRGNLTAFRRPAAHGIVKAATNTNVQSVNQTRRDARGGQMGEKMKVE